MGSKKNTKEYIKEYKKRIQELRIELYPTDEDIKQKIASVLESGETKAGYVKRLIRKDIERAQAESEEKGGE